MSSPSEQSGPYYPLDAVREVLSDPDRCFVTHKAENDCYALGLVTADIWEAMNELDQPRCEFRKSMPSIDRSGEMFDVYHVLIGLKIVYMKFKIVTRKDGQNIVVISFKER